MKVYLYDRKEYVSVLDEGNLKLLTEIDTKIGFEDLLRFNGKVYCICSAKPVKEGSGYEYIVVNEIPYDPEVTETIYENYITCPICGNVDYDSYPEDENTYICPHCSAELEIKVNYEITYSAKVKKAKTIVSI